MVRRERRNVAFLSEHLWVQADSGRQKEATFRQQTDFPDVALTAIVAEKNANS
jgi:hypothetical protein